MTGNQLKNQNNIRLLFIILSTVVSFTFIAIGISVSERETKQMPEDFIESYGNYLGARDLFMEVYGISNKWIDVYPIVEVEDTFDLINKKFPGPVPRF